MVIVVDIMFEWDVIVAEEVAFELVLDATEADMLT